MRVGVMQAMSLTHDWNDTLAQKVREEETQVDRYEDALGTYLVKLSGRELNHADSQSVNTLLHTISDFERISDHSVNLMESAEEMHTKEIQFSQDARDELQVLEDAVQDILNRTTDAFRKGDLHLASKVEPLEAVVNELVRAIKAHHIARLQAGSCSIEYGFVLDDLLTNYERVCDHCSRTALIPTHTSTSCVTAMTPRKVRNSIAVLTVTVNAISSLKINLRRILTNDLYC